MSIFNAFYGVFLLGISIGLFFALYKKTKDIFNPFGIMIITWGTVCSIAAQHPSILDTEWTINMYLVGFAFPIAVALGFYTGNTKYIQREKKYERFRFSLRYVYLSRFIFLICMICAFMEWRAQGFTLSLLSTGSSSDTKSLVATLPGWHYGSYYFAFCSINACFELCFRKGLKSKDKLQLWFCLMLPVLHCLLVASSRGSLLIILLGCLFILSRKYTFKFVKIQLAGLLIILLLLRIAEQRITSTSLVFRIIPGHPALSALYGYTGLNFENLNKLTKAGPNFTIFLRSFYGIWQMTGISAIFPENEKIQTVFFNAVPIAYDFYDDLWIIGVILYGFIYTKGIKVIYHRCNRNLALMPLFAALQKAIWVVFFGNYFLGYRIILFPYIISFLLSIANKKVKKVKKIILR